MGIVQSKEAEALLIRNTWFLKAVRGRQQGKQLGMYVQFWRVVVMKPAHKKIEKIVERLRIQPLRGGNLLYITQMNNFSMIQMTRPPFYI